MYDSDSGDSKPSAPSDVYGGRQHGREDAPEPLPQDAELQVSPEVLQHWKRLVNQQARRNLMFGISVSLFVVLVLAYLIYSLSYVPRQAEKEKAIAAVPEAAKPTPEGIRVRTQSSVLDGPSRQSMVFLLDDLKKVDGISEVPEGGAPFESKWVMVAGSHLARAQSAMRAGDHPEALEQYNKAARIFPNLLGIQAYVGLLHLEQQEYNTAITHLANAAAESPLDHSLLNNLGVAYLALKEYAPAERYFRECIRLQPSYAMARYNLASLFFEQNLYEDTVKILPGYLKLKPDNVEAAQMYARSLIALKRWEEAATILEDVLLIQPGVPTVLFRLAQCQSMAGDKQAGLLTLNRAVQLVDRNQALSWMSRNAFNQLRGEPEFQTLLNKLIKKRS